MGQRKTRRGFLGLVGAAAPAAVFMGASAARGDEPKKEGKEGKKKFSGTSKKANFEEALGLAIKEAHKSAKGADRLVQWTLKEVSGRDGGIAGFTELTVTIEATIG
jgi:hypothetical protein